jgi:ribose-phosphate pyrophosphokinase
MSIEVKVEGHKVEIDIWKFPTGETGVKLSNFCQGRTDDSFLITVNFEGNDDIINCLQIVDALKNMNIRGYQIMVDIPYLPYSRQDRVCHAGEAFGLRVLCDVLKTMNVVVRTKDLHSNVAFDQLDVRGYLVNVPQFVCAAGLPKFDNLIAPDKGAAAKISMHLQVNAGTKVHVANKQRIGSKVVHMDFEYDTIQGTACVVDDLCDGGATFISIADMIRRTQPNVTELCLYVTHGAFTQGVKKLSEMYDTIYCHNFMNSKGLVDITKIKLI